MNQILKKLYFKSIPFIIIFIQPIYYFQPNVSNFCWITAAVYGRTLPCRRTNGLFSSLCGVFIFNPIKNSQLYAELIVLHLPPSRSCCKRQMLLSVLLMQVGDHGDHGSHSLLLMILTKCSRLGKHLGSWKYLFLKCSFNLIRVLAGFTPCQAGHLIIMRCATETATSC